MTQQHRALPRKIEASSLEGALPRPAGGGGRAPARRRRVLTGALFGASLLGLTSMAGSGGFAHADPDTSENPAPVVAMPAVPQNLDQLRVDPKLLSAVTTYLPALIGAASQPGVRDTAEAQQLIQQVQTLVNQVNLPPEYRTAVNRSASMLRNETPSPVPPATAAANGIEPQEPSPGAPTLPISDDSTPRIQEFMLPTIGMNCIANPDGSGNAVGKALVTAGPQEAPAPGPKAGEAGYVFTALGTGAAAADQERPLTVSWFNLDTGLSGQQTLLPNPAINATTGPGTFTAIIATGKGRVLSTVFGSVTTKTTDEPRTCGITPTVGMARI